METKVTDCYSHLSHLFRWLNFEFSPFSIFLWHQAISYGNRTSSKITPRCLIILFANSCKALLLLNLFILLIYLLHCFGLRTLPIINVWKLLLNFIKTRSNRVTIFIFIKYNSHKKIKVIKTYCSKFTCALYQKRIVLSSWKFSFSVHEGDGKGDGVW